MPITYPPGYGRVQGPSGATGGLGSTQTGYQDPRRRRLQRPELAGPAPVPPPYSLGAAGGQLSDILREAALQRRAGRIGESADQSRMPFQSPVESLDLPVEDEFPWEREPPPPGGPFEDVLASPEDFAAMLQEAAMRGRLQGGRQVSERRQRQGSIADTVNAVSEAIQRRLDELRADVR